MKYRILIVDDEANIRETISDILVDEGYEVITATDGLEGQKKAFHEEVDAVILDVMLPGKGGMEVLQYLHQELPLLPVLIISGHGDIKMAVEAMKRGAYDFLEKPLSMERIISSVRNAVKLKELQMENLKLKSRLESARFIGESPSVKSILASIPQIAQSGASVLVTGENGTGKEVIARMIHNQSQRRFQPFVGVNCAAIPETLIESELFGFEKGAFTGAIKQKKGKFESAHLGTLFLDEVADLSLSAQAKVLRVLQEKEIERVGGSQTISVDVRIIAATNKDLADEIKNGKFRQDLYYRLNVIPVHLPPLRERKDDIVLLVEYFIDEYVKKAGRVVEIAPSALRVLESRKWAGNVRELQNFVERLFILSSKQTIEAEDVLRLCYPENEELLNRYEAMSLKSARQEFEKSLIISRLIRFQNNITRTAESLGLERTYLYKKMKELGLEGSTGMDDSALV